jgi:hypothetical protein
MISGTKNGGFRMAGVDGHICKNCVFNRDHFTTEEAVKIVAYTKHVRTKRLKEMKDEQNRHSHS